MIPASYFYRDAYRGAFEDCGSSAEVAAIRPSAGRGAVRRAKAAVLRLSQAAPPSSLDVWMQTQPRRR